MALRLRRGPHAGPPGASAAPTSCCPWQVRSVCVSGSQTFTRRGHIASHSATTQGAGFVHTSVHCPRGVQTPHLNFPPPERALLWDESERCGARRRGTVTEAGSLGQRERPGEAPSTGGQLQASVGNTSTARPEDRK